MTTKTSERTLAIIVLLLLPLGIIWAINTLSGLGIEYTFKNWVAAAILGIIFRGKADR